LSDVKPRIAQRIGMEDDDKFAKTTFSASYSFTKTPIEDTDSLWEIEDYKVFGMENPTLKPANVKKRNRFAAKSLKIEGN